MLTNRRVLASGFQFIVNMAMLVASLLIIWYFVDQYTGKHMARWLSRSSTASALKGKELPSVLLAGQGKKTVVLVLSTKCRYCESEVPTYRELAHSLKGKRVGVVAVFPDDSSTAATFLQAHGLGEVQLRPNAFATLGIRATPTLLLVNTKGIASKVIEGAQAASAREITQMIESID